MDPIKRRPVAEAMLKVRVGGMHRLDEDRYIDRDLVTHAEYQLFLDELRIKGEYRQPARIKPQYFQSADEPRGADGGGRGVLLPVGKPNLAPA